MRSLAPLKRHRPVALLALSLIGLLTAGPARAGVSFYTSPGAWAADVDTGIAMGLPTDAMSLALADELSTPPAQDEALGPQLTFQAANTGLCGSFVLETLEAGAGLTFADGEPSPAIFPDGTISIGDIGDFQNDDFQIRFPTNSFFAFSFFLVDNVQKPQESFQVYGVGGLIGTLPGSAIPDSRNNGSTFVGVVADEPITRVRFDEDTTVDDVAIRDFQFGCALEDPDGDGLSNLAERAAGTQPDVADTDGDGLLDGDELGTGSFGPQQLITTLASGARFVHAADLDGDGDADVLSASQFDDEIAWYENTDGAGSFGAQQVISNAADGAFQVISADVDGDGALDVLATGPFQDLVAWYHNDDGLGGFGAQQVVTSMADGAAGVYPSDIDSDGDVDVLSASFFDHRIAWYENTDGLGSFGGQQTLTTAAVEARFVFAVDIDRDGDPDVLSAAQGDDQIEWYENTDGAGAFSTAKLVTGLADGAQAVFGVDLDGDGDVDVLSASNVDDQIAWYENTDGAGSFGPEQVITGLANGAEAVFAADLDGDGDADVFSASSVDDKIAWYENDGAGGFGPQHVITTLADGAESVFAIDLDGDGDVDVLSASAADGEIAWYEQLNVADPLDPDTDDDGLLDGFEVTYGFDPLVPGEQTADPDMDGLDNLGEQAAGTDPFDADTDDDGFSDGVEVAAGTDPLDPLDFPGALPPKVPALPGPAAGLLLALLGGLGAGRLPRGGRAGAR